MRLELHSSITENFSRIASVGRNDYAVRPKIRGGVSAAYGAGCAAEVLSAMNEKRKQAFLLFAVTGSQIVRRVSREDGEQGEQLGSMDPVFSQDAIGTNGQPELIGWRILAAKPVDDGFSSRPSPAGITAHEMLVNAGMFGGSRTARMTELDRMNRQKDGEPAEDEIERVRAKVMVFPRVGSAKGDILRAWPIGAA